jgi:metal-sulfur cluster biosynthetic enzyme
MGWYFMQQSDQRLADLPGVDRVIVALDNGLEWTPDMMAEHVREARAALFDRARVVSGRTE